MNLSEMILAISRRVDDTVTTPNAVEWLNSAKNKMAIAVKAKFPDLSQNDTSTEYTAIDSKYHEALVMYASARFKEYDGIFSDASFFLQEFNEMVKDFQANFEVPPYYRDDHISQQFVATQSAQTFTITKLTYDKNQGDLIAYINNIKTDNYTINSDGTVTVWDCVAGDNVTLLWENHVDIVEPPYSWWGRW